MKRPVKVTAGAAPAPVATVPVWTGTDGAYTYQMIGASPMTAGAGTTRITTDVIPLILTFADGTVSDPTAASLCSAQPPMALVLGSPLFNNFSYTAGSVSAGSTQYLDFFQRANFWQYTGAASGASPNYHTLLSAAPVGGIKIAVPDVSGSTLAAGCGRLGAVNVDWFDSYLRASVFPRLAALGVVPGNLAVFVTSNVVMYETATSNCCILGYHSGFANPTFGNAVQTYVVTDFETSGDFGKVRDISSLSHEAGEWLDDPTGGNPTPPWGNTGQVTGCQNDLEVGDPLSGTFITVTMPNGYDYHPQELAFKSWFYRDATSSGVNGWYSSNGTFKAPAGACGTAKVTLSVTPASSSAGTPVGIRITAAAEARSSGIPTGSVALMASNSATPLATYTLSGGVVNASIVLPAGNYNLAADYGGDQTFGAIPSAPIAVTVAPAVGAASGVVFSPAALTFPGQAPGAAGTPQSLSLTNKGTAPLAVRSISLTGTSAADFSQSNNCGSVVAVNGACTISIQFRPTATGPRVAAVAVADNAAGSPHTVALSGTGVAPSVPLVTLSPSALSFAPTPIGASSALQVVTIQNTGAAVLQFGAIFLAGVNPFDFTGFTSCGQTLAAGSSCMASIAFKPAAAGARSATFNVVDNAASSPQTIAVTGTGTGTPPAPTAMLNPTSVVFGGTASGVASAAVTITLTNTGNAPLAIGSIAIGGKNPGDFSQTDTCGSTLPVSASCTFSVAFRPTAKGTRIAALTINDNAPGSSQTIALSGTGR